MWYPPYFCGGVWQAFISKTLMHELEMKKRECEWISKQSVLISRFFHGFLTVRFIWFVFNNPAAQTDQDGGSCCGSIFILHDLRGCR